MEPSERSFLLERSLNSADSSSSNSGLSVIFAIICIVDVFGVFPIVSLPKAIIDCGYTGVLLVIIICGTQIFTAILLGKCWLIAEDIDPSIQFKNRYPYSALAEMTCGKNLSKVVTLLLDLTIFGGGIPNLIVASQNLQLVGLKLTNGSFTLSFCYWMIIMGTIICPLLWFGSPKDMKILCSVSVTLVITVFMLVFSCILTDLQTTSSQLPQENTFYLWKNVLSAYGILAFQFDIHPTILTIQVDMRDKSKIIKAVIGAFIVSLALFALTSIVVFIHFGKSVGPSILEMLPSTIGLHFAAILVALQLSLSSAISNTALYQHIEDRMGIPRGFNYKRCVIRSILAVLSILVAESVPRFDIVMSLIGAALTGPLVFILPPLFYIKMLSLKRIHEENLQLECFHNVIYNTGGTSKTLSKYMETSFNEEMNINLENSEINIAVQNRSFTINILKSLHVVVCGLVIVFGIFATIVATYWNVVNTMHYVTFSPPCILNIYNATFYNG